MIIKYKILISLQLGVYKKGMDGHSLGLQEAMGDLQNCFVWTGSANGGMCVTLAGVNHGGRIKSTLGKTPEQIL